jgi:hypothetical protein
VQKHCILSDCLAHTSRAGSITCCARPGRVPYILALDRRRPSILLCTAGPTFSPAKNNNLHGRTCRYSRIDGSARLPALRFRPLAIGLDARGHILICDYDLYRVREQHVDHNVIDFRGNRYPAPEIFETGQTTRATGRCLHRFLDIDSYLVSGRAIQLAAVPRPRRYHPVLVCRGVRRRSWNGMTERIEKAQLELR